MKWSHDVRPHSHLLSSVSLSPPAAGWGQPYLPVASWITQFGLIPLSRSLSQRSPSVPHVLDYHVPNSNTHTHMQAQVTVFDKGQWGSISPISPGPADYGKSFFFSLPQSLVCPYHLNLFQSLKLLCHRTPATALCRGSLYDAHRGADKP